MFRAVLLLMSITIMR